VAMRSHMRSHCLGGRANTLKDNESILANATDLLQQTSLKGLRHSGPTAPFSIALAASFLLGVPVVGSTRSRRCVPRSRQFLQTRGALSIVALAKPR
jgi:hypothetical protein